MYLNNDSFTLNNEKLLKDEQYLGWRHPRISEEKYDEFIDHFVASVRKHFPKQYMVVLD